jgi:hypothetical protein
VEVIGVVFTGLQGVHRLHAVPRMDARLPWSLLGAAGSFLLVKRLGAHSGATDDEVHATLPGDDVIPHPMVETTHAIDIDAPPSVVWSWLVQCGYRGAGRAGWYTDSLVDPLMERVVFRFLIPADKQPEGAWKHSADEILPAFQHTAAGDVVPDGPPGSAWFVVRAVDPERAWVLHSDSHIRYMTPTFLHGTSLQTTGEFTWVFVLRPRGAEGTRLLLRTRARYGPKAARPLLMPMLYAGEALFPRLLLRGIKRRAEQRRAIH